MAWWTRAELEGRGEGHGGARAEEKGCSARRPRAQKTPESLLETFVNDLQLYEYDQSPKRTRLGLEKKVLGPCSMSFSLGFAECRQKCTVMAFQMRSRGDRRGPNAPISTTNVKQILIC